MAPREFVVVSGFGQNSLVNAEYSSHLCPNGTVMEMIRLGHDPDARGKVSAEELEQWIQRQRDAIGGRCIHDGHGRSNMRAIIRRLRRPEMAAAPNEKICAAAEAIREARRKRLGADYQEIEYPLGSFDCDRGRRIDSSAGIRSLR